MNKVLIGAVTLVFAIGVATTNGVHLIDRNDGLTVKNLLKTTNASAEGSSTTCYSNYYSSTQHKVTSCWGCKPVDGYGYGSSGTCN